MLYTLMGYVFMNVHLIKKNMYTMFLILDGNSEVSAQVRNNLCYLIFKTHLIRPKAVTNSIFCSPKPLFTFTRAQHGLGYHLIKYQDVCRT